MASLFRTQVLAILVSAVVCPAAQKQQKAQPSQPRWEQEPQGFKNLKFGSTAQELREIGLNFEACVTDPADAAIEHCYIDLSVGDYSASCVLSFWARHFSSITGRFPSKVIVNPVRPTFDNLRDIFIERYGVPHKTLEDSGGVVLGWNGVSASVSLIEYMSGSENGGFVISLNAYASHKKRLDATKRTDAVKKRTDAVKKAAKDL